MSAVSKTDVLLRDLVRLRGGPSVPPSADDIAAVRRDLEEMVGPTVKRAAAARLLGVSQTALDRWIGAGDIPVVITPEGRREVPLRALVELAAEVGERRRAGEPNPLAAALRKRRSDAERLDPGAVLPRRLRREIGRPTHRGAELRSLAYHRALAIRLDARTVEDARERLQRWRAEGKIDPRYAERWEEILSWPLPRIARFVGSDREEARALRQSSPFAGALNERERERVLAALAAA